MAHIPLAGSERSRIPGARCVGDTEPDERLQVVVVLRRQAPDEFHDIADRLMAGEMPKPLSRQAFSEKFAPVPDEITRVIQFAQQYGLTVVRQDTPSGTLVLGGTATQFNAAFSIRLQRYQHAGGSYRSCEGAIHLPEDLHAIVTAVVGLDDRPQARTHFRFRPPSPLSAHAALNDYLPTQVASLYDFPNSTGSGECIALIELGGNYRAADARTYFSELGVHVPVVTVVSTDGSSHTAAGEPGGADGEVMLDVEIAGALAPQAHLVLYFGANSDAGFIQALNSAVHDDQNRPTVISISWGGPEPSWAPQSLQAFGDALKAAAMMGITVCAASGDNGADDGLAPGDHVDFPASNPYVLACGGTRLQSADGAIQSETVWNDGPQGGATGGGVSTVYGLPVWQRQLTTSTSSGTMALTGRGVPDVAGNADPATGYRVRVDSSSQVVGGTSAVAPLWAALIARINALRSQPTGYANPRLYGNPAAFNDITQGSNGGFSAAKGWDACTGLGSPDGRKVAGIFETTRKEPANRTSIDSAKDQPYFDPTAYGNGPDDSVTDVTERAAVTHHTMRLNGRTLTYTAKAGHLVAVDASSSKPSTKIFYVSFCADGERPRNRPVTFFYNGGPGSSSVFVLLGSFAPRRIKTAMPAFTPPAPYTLEDNPDSLLDKSDLVFINPVGTGYSAAIAPWKNQNFWGVDQDAASLKQFIKRYLTENDRWNSPKFLFGESYGTARSAVLSYVLHEDGVDLNGVTLQSSILDYTQAGNPVGALPTAAADAWYHKRLGVRPVPADLPAFMETVCGFAHTEFTAALHAYPNVLEATMDKLSQYAGIDRATLMAWHLDIAAGDEQGHTLFLTHLLKGKALALGAYDGRVTGLDAGIAHNISPNSGSNDPTMTAVSGVYTAMWNSYLNEELKFTSDSAFTDLNDRAFQHWDFSHIDPTGAQKGVDDKGNVVLYTAGDLAATMSLNVDLKVLSANGYYDFVTPFFQTVTDLQAMPLGNAATRKNLATTFYPSGHMVYLDGASRTALKADVAAMMDAATADHAAVSRIRVLQTQKPH